MRRFFDLRSYLDLNRRHSIAVHNDGNKRNVALRAAKTHRTLVNDPVHHERRRTESRAGDRTSMTAAVTVNRV